ncbi:hypothetical protein [Limosilactobacillus fermentum]|uniref:hypothetical protein n=1 Tax=Limosilactobacillus fermentum TaxID=1613 RepID=UPI0023E3C8EC|nr:hypothetical protein [Limosilactobacillus fermentum]MDF4005775.1 hypothetical protein [Limosilactobacillus fermentum]MDF4014853.1 hypothetical protein [Limosilactobacillus fermentum]
MLGNDWYQPGQINKPGLWFKVHPFCSAALSGYEAAKMLWNKGVRWSDCVQVVVHYPPNGDRVLNQQWPQTGQESKFSIEFIIWQVLKFGDVKDADFTARFVDSQFKIDVAKIVRKHDLATTSATKRPTLVETVTRRGIVKQLVVMPLGSPNRSLSSEKLQEKLLMVLPKEKVAALVDLIVKKKRYFKRYIG